MSGHSFRRTVPPMSVLNPQPVLLSQTSGIKSSALGMGPQSVCMFMASCVRRRLLLVEHVQAPHRLLVVVVVSKPPSFGMEVSTMFSSMIGRSLRLKSSGFTRSPIRCSEGQRKVILP